MMKLNQWLSNQAKRGERFISIADLLFSNKSVAYIYFRLRYFNWLVLIRLVFHLSIFAGLHQSLPARNFSIVALVWAATLIINAAWWGGLEVLRTRVRDYYHTKNTEALQQEISYWLILGILGGIILTLLSLMFGVYGISSGQPTLIFLWSFAGSLCLSLAIRLSFEPYHSGIYAISRVLRPLWSLVIGEVFSFLFILIGWHWLQHWVLPIAMILTSLINTLLRYYYCKRLYDFYEWRLSFNPLTIGRWLRELPLRDLVLAALAMSLMQLEGPALLASVKFQQTHELYYQLFNALFLTLPLLNASSEWAQLFYFDWKKLRRFNFSGLHQRYDKTILLLSPMMGCFLGLAAVGVSHFFLPNLSSMVYGMVALLIILRAIIAYLQIRSFACFYYWDVIVGAAMLLGILGIAYIYMANPWFSMASMGLGSILLIYWLIKPRLSVIDKASQFKQQVIFYDWLTQLCQVKGALQIGVLSVAPYTSYYKVLRIVSWLIQSFLQKQDRVCIVANKIIFYQINPGSEKSIELNQIAINTGGLVQDFSLSSVIYKQQKSILFELQAYLKENVLKHLIEKVPASDFFTRFPDGLMFTPKGIMGPLAKTADKNTIQGLLYQAELYLTGQATGPFPYEVVVSYDQGTINTIYAVPKASYPRKILQAWRREVDSANIQRITVTRAEL